MTYRATITSNIGLYALGLIIAVLLVVAGCLSRPTQIWFLIAGGVLVGWMAAIRLRYVVRVSGEELQSRTLVGQSRVKWHDLTRVEPATDGGYWSSRLFGPSVLEFVSPASRIRVNFKLFPAECLQDVMQHVPPGARFQG